MGAIQPLTSPGIIFQVDKFHEILVRLGSLCLRPLYSKGWFSTLENGPFEEVFLFGKLEFSK